MLTAEDLKKIKVIFSNTFNKKFRLTTTKLFENLITREEFNKQEDKKLEEIKKIHKILTKLNNRLSQSN